MRILALDTSTFVGTVAVLRDGELLSEWGASVRASHGETLLPRLAQVLEAAQLSLAEIDLFAVGLGPGSFTGVRIGVATAKGLALAEAKPLVGVPSLRVIARGMTAGSLRAVAVDAHKNELYCALYELTAQGELRELLPPFHELPGAAALRLREAANERPVCVAGNGVERYGDDFTRPFEGMLTRVPAFCDVPRAACLAHEAERIFAAQGPSDLSRLEPLYVRASDAKLPAPK
ncbi:MAG: TsaB protein required for threonylcarbamoyladenosine ((6)A) formation in tRNA [Myxococcaceae bacterium]|nr:TsaB protein required for threonylcarbamoyladenosine ((6)A) formation in tRNA [Myxococcaceae bacterium]